MSEVLVLVDCDKSADGKVTKGTPILTVKPNSATPEEAPA